MFGMNAEQFNQLAAEGYNRIPVVQEVLADLETPLSAYLKLADSPFTYLLESVQGGEKWGRYSIIGLPCRTLLKVYGNDIQILTDGQVIEQHQCDDPLAFVEAFRQRYQVAEFDHLPRFNGGLVGYFGYDTVRYIEPRLKQGLPADELGTPDILLMVSDDVLVFDNLSGKILIVSHLDPREENAWAKGQARQQQLLAQLQQAVQPPQDLPMAAVAESDFRSSFGQEAFEQAVDKVKEYILAGDCMQVVPSQRMSIPFSAEPLNLYRALRCLNPSPYMFFFNLDEFHIVGSSPEILARCEEGMVTVRPIAGTRKRGVDEAADLALEQDLLADPKEVAEHLMLIDLGRNDVGRVAEVGSVELTDKMVVERYSHVMHIVSNVTGRLKPGLNAIDVLKATFPAGTLSGAPKIRAMEIIDELEPVKRGIYGGAVGYLSWKGDMDTAIAIRTAVIKDQRLYVQAGAGVVADSQPRLEWEETMNKGRAIFRAVEMVQKGLNSSS